MVDVPTHMDGVVKAEWNVTYKWIVMPGEGYRWQGIIIKDSQHVSYGVWWH